MNYKTIKSAVQAIALSCLSLIFLGSSFSKPEKKNIGLQLYSIRDSISKDVKGSVRKIGNMGYKFVEPAGYSNGKFYGLTPKEFKELCRKNNLRVLSSHTTRALPDLAGWETAMAWWDTCIAAHVEVGAKYIVAPSMDRIAYQSLEGLKRYCDYFNAIGEKCNASGIRFGFHNHNREFTTLFDKDIVLYDYLLKNTDPVKVMFQIDLYWCVDGGADPVSYFKRYPGRFELWHIKDREEIGSSGLMDFKSIWASAKTSGMKYGIVEVEKYNFDQFTSCQKSLDFLNTSDYVIMPKRK